MFGAKDPDGEPITLYSFFNYTSDPNTGHFRVGTGYKLDQSNQVVTVSGDQRAGEITFVPASDFGKVDFITGSAPGLNQLFFAAYDGHMWSPIQVLSVTTGATNSPTLALPSMSEYKGVQAADSGSDVAGLLRTLSAQLGSALANDLVSPSAGAPKCSCSTVCKCDETGSSWI
jgi:hypothetical protein